MHFPAKPVALVSLLSLVVTMADAAEPGLTFEKDVRPILKTHCFHCGENGYVITPDIRSNCLLKVLANSILQHGQNTFMAKAFSIFLFL